MRHHDEHLTDEEIRQFVEKHGAEILEVIREQNLVGLDDATRFQSALAELSVRWGVVPPSDTPLSELLAEAFDDEEDDEPA
ncbi:MAG TPA: hypothetical protein VEW48_26205 [Thermoanaerobaculia bacterium]|nr:hypothetical protein [Thermoanaerobaculia bacterium]